MEYRLLQLAAVTVLQLGVEWFVSIFSVSPLSVGCVMRLTGPMSRSKHALFFTFLYSSFSSLPLYCLFLISLAPNMSKIWLVHMAFQLFPCRNSCLTSQIKPMPMFLKEQLQHLQKWHSFKFLISKWTQFNVWRFGIYVGWVLIHKNRT